MILTPAIRLELVLTAAKTTNDMDVTVDYVDWNTQGIPTTPSTYRIASNGSTDVIILAAPVANPIREPLRVIVFNRDTATKTVRVKTDVLAGGTEFIEREQSLLTLESLCWEKGVGWYVH